MKTRTVWIALALVVVAAGAVWVWRAQPVPAVKSGTPAKKEVAPATPQERPPWSNERPPEREPPRSLPPVERTDLNAEEKARLAKLNETFMHLTAQIEKARNDLAKARGDAIRATPESQALLKDLNAARDQQREWVKTDPELARARSRVAELQSSLQETMAQHARLVEQRKEQNATMPECQPVLTAEERAQEQAIRKELVDLQAKVIARMSQRRTSTGEPTHLMRIETITSNLQSRVDADIKVKEAASQLKKLEEERQNAARERAHLLYARGGSSPKNVVETRTE